VFFPTGDDRPLVLVTLGMDHHPFNRLMRWVDGWLAAGASERVRCLAQTGPAIRPARAVCTEFLDYDELEHAMTQAVVVACHAGPGTIMICRAAGQKPVVVPRLPHRGEVVDDHQVRFARQLSLEGIIELAEEEASFRALMDAAVERGTVPKPPPPDGRTTEPIAQFDRLVTGLLVARG
jgi:UDP-N-acetylglucosamine transferase subunit ALG13